MPAFREKASERQLKYMQDKYINIKDETKSVLQIFHDCLHIFERRITELKNCEADSFTLLYRKLNNDFENFQEKLMLVQATVELPPDSESSLELATKDECTDLFENNEDFTPEHFCSFPSVSCALSEFHPKNSKNIFSIPSVLTSTELPNSKVAFQSSFSNQDKVKSVQSSPSTSYVSVQDSNDFIVPQTQISNFHTAALTEFNQNVIQNEGTLSEEVNEDYLKLTNFQANNGALSLESLSQASCYQSLSSTFSDFCYQSDVADGLEVLTLNNSICNESSTIVTLETVEKIIPTFQITLPFIAKARLTYIENPENFWMCLEESSEPIPSFPKNKYANSPMPLQVKKNAFYLAPSKLVPVYLRVQVLSEVQEGTEDISVFYVDHGIKQMVSLKELRVLPNEAYDICMQAINCFLAEISAPNNIWCYAAIEKFKQFCNNSLEAQFKIKNGDKYGVQLTATIPMLDEEFSCDIGQTLSIEGFAIENELKYENNLSNPALCEKEQTSSSPISNQISCDSGVSVFSNQQSSSSCQYQRSSNDAFNTPELSDSLQPIEELENPKRESKMTIEENSKRESKMTIEENPQIEFTDLISFESLENLNKEISISIEEQAEDSVDTIYNKCLKICTCDCPLHVIIPYPSVTFVEDDFILVMISNIVDPNEFYVNMAMEGSSNLDELLEQMTSTYNSLPSGNNHLLLDDLKEGVFCAAVFEDKNWYRVKILSVHLKFNSSPNVYVQYVDYGNKAWVRNSDLRTLTPEFSKHPSHSIKCSLAGIVPKKDNSTDQNSQLWSEDAVKAFKELIDFEHCFTAQVCGNRKILNDDPLQVFLWDTKGETDMMVNELLIEGSYAEIDKNFYETLSSTPDKKNDIEILNHWDPMTEEFNSVQNSYGVNVEDFQVAIGGYKQNDEQYICKYFSGRGRCPDKNCTKEHIPFAEGGVTRDQDELFAFGYYPPLPVCGSNVLVQVSAVKSPSHFYIQLPFRNLDVDELDSLINKGSNRENLLNREVFSLFEELNSVYSKKAFNEDTTIALAYGNIVVAKRQNDKTWHRARIIDVQDIDGPAKVFYVDFGNEEWVERRNIRQIEPEYLYTPFQAIECSLSDVEPLGYEKHRAWSTLAISCFKELVTETIMLAHVYDEYNSKLTISLKRTTENDHLNIKDHLIREGFAQEEIKTVSKKPLSRYIPG